VLEPHELSASASPMPSATGIHPVLLMVVVCFRDLT
jgi:hypothetical protein